MSWNCSYGFGVLVSFATWVFGKVYGLHRYFPLTCDIWGLEMVYQRFRLATSRKGLYWMKLGLTSSGYLVYSEIE